MMVFCTFIKISAAEVILAVLERYPVKRDHACPASSIGPIVRNTYSKSSGKPLTGNVTENHHFHFIDLL